MNARKIVSSILSSLVFGWLLAATVPAFTTSAMDISPFQAFVVTPVLIMLEGLIGLVIYHSLTLGIGGRHLRLLHGGARHKTARPRGRCLAARREAAGENAGQKNGHGRWAA